MYEYLTDYGLTQELRRLEDFSEMKRKADEDIEEIQKRIEQIKQELEQRKGPTK